MKRSLRITSAATAVLVAAVWMGVLVCYGGQSAADGQAAPVAALQIKGAGATFPEPLYQKWIGRYQAGHPGVAFTYEGVGSGEGIKRFIAEKVDFGASDAAMNDAEIAQVQRGVKLIPATAGMVVLAYNLPGVEGELRLPRDVYPDIFLGKVRRWDDPRIVAANPHLKLPSKLIQTVVRRESSGTTFAFTNHLSAISTAWREGPGIGKQIDWPGGAMTGRGNEGVAQKVKISQGSIGYMEYGFARRLGLPIAVLQNKAGHFVKPDADSGRTALAAAASADLPANLRLFVPDPAGADSYPIVSLTWILLYDRYPDPAKAAALKEALAWGLSEGQAIAAEMGYIPLPKAITAKAAQAVATIH
jgi:phosphate transport system substrate-binding protein